MKQKAPSRAESEDGKVLEGLGGRRSSVMASGSGERELGGLWERGERTGSG